VNARLADRDFLAAFRRRTRRPVAVEMLDEDHRIVVGDGRQQQAVTIGRIGRHHHLDPGRVAKPGFQEVGMLAAILEAGAGHGADDHRHMGLAAGHEAQLGGMVGDLVHADADEIHQHDFDHRPHADHRGADGGTHEAHLGNRSGAHARAVFGRQTLRDLDDAAAFRIGDFLAEDDDVLVGFHRIVQRPVQGLNHVDRGRSLGFCAHVISPQASSWA
jgi:hypothetical protein